MLHTGHHKGSNGPRYLKRATQDSRLLTRTLYSDFHANNTPPSPTGSAESRSDSAFRDFDSSVETSPRLRWDFSVICSKAVNEKRKEKNSSAFVFKKLTEKRVGLPSRPGSVALLTSLAITSSWLGHQNDTRPRASLNKENTEPASLHTSEIFPCKRI